MPRPLSLTAKQTYFFVTEVFSVITGEPNGFRYFIALLIRFNRMLSKYGRKVLTVEMTEKSSVKSVLVYSVPLS